MAMDHDRIDSELANMQIAYDRAAELMRPHIAEEVVAPAVIAVIESNIKALLELEPTLAMLVSINPSILGTLAMSYMHTLFSGVEWGKAGREFYTVAEHEACEDPSHDHHISRRN